MIEEKIEQFLKPSWPILSALIAGIEEGLADARHFFEEKKKPYDPWLFPHLVRSQICWNLRELDSSDIEFTTRDLPMSGIEISYRGKVIKVFKADDGTIPPPGRSRRRREFYNRNLFGSDLEVFELPSWAVIWDMDGVVQLVFPKDAKDPYKSGSQRMAITLPHPAEVDWAFVEAHASECADLTELSEGEGINDDLDIAASEAD